MSENLPAVAPRAREDRAEAYERPEPQPGTYWRARTDVPSRSRTETYQRESWGRRDDEVRLGQKVVEERGAMAEGSVVLLRHVGRVDGYVHTLVTSPDPSVRGDHARTWLIDDFERWLEPVDDADAAALRSRQVAGTLGRIEGIRSEMAALAGGVSEVQASLPSPGSIQAGATPDDLGKARERARAAQGALQVRADDMRALNVRLVDETRELVDLQTERATAAVSSVQDALDTAEAAAKAAETMDLFGGDKVEVIEVLRGNGAPAGTAVTLYQNMLYLDEELAVHLHQGGFDASNFEELSDIFARTPGLLDRVAGAPRAVVLVRVRRKEKPIERNADLSEVLRSLSLAQANREQFLLLRDGERVTFVFSEIAMQDASRLFPTLDEMNRPFRGAGGADQITVKDARFTNALGEFERQALVYKRLLVLLWGLEFDERRPLGLLEADGRPGNWQDPAWQEAHCAFVHDDHTRSLPDARPPIQDYLRANAELLQPGSRVIVHWNRVIDTETAPSITFVPDQDSDRFHVTHRPEQSHSVHVVREGPEGGLVVDVPVRRTAFGRGRETFRAAVDLSRHGGETAYLVLDGIEDDDLSYYVESRENRRHYLDYLDLFRHARKALAETFAEVRAVDARLASRLVGDLPGHAPDHVRRAAKDAHRMWRALNGGKVAPARAEREIRDAAFMTLTGTPTAEGIFDIAGVRPEEALLAGVDGKARIEVMLPGPADPLVATRCWVERRRFSQDAKGTWRQDGAVVGRVHRLAEPSLDVRHRSRSLEGYVAGSHLPEGLGDRGRTASVLVVLAKASPALVDAEHRNVANASALAAAWNASTRRLTFGKRTGDAWERKGVREAHEAVVVAAVVDLSTGWDRKAPRIGYLCVTSDPLARALNADPSTKGIMEGYAAGIWAHGGSHRIEAASKRAAAMAEAAAEGLPAHGMRLGMLGGETTDALLNGGSPSIESRYSVNDIDWQRRPSGSSGEEGGDWEAFRRRFNLRTRSGNGTEPVARIVGRRDTWDWLVRETGWPAEIPPDIEFVEVPPAA